MKKCIVTFANGSFKRFIKRNTDSFFGYDYLVFNDVNSIGAPDHKVAPYGFKAYCLEEAIKRGYTHILWCDSPIYATQSLYDVFKYIDKHGYLFFNNIGHGLGKWTSDKCLEHFNISRHDSFNIKMIMACCMGFKVDYPILLDYILQCKNKSIISGEWTNENSQVSKHIGCKGHRHDQSIISCLIHKYKLNIITGHETFFAYEQHKNVFELSDSVCLISDSKV